MTDSLTTTALAPLANNARTYICERCGGSGQQESGMPTPEGWGYSDLAGVCNMCKGAGILAPPSPIAEWHAHLDLQVRAGQMAKDTATTYRQGMRKLTEWASQPITQ